MSNGDDKPHHDNNKKLITHPTYITDLFEKTLVAFAIEAKGEPWYIDNGANKHVTGSVEALNHVKASVEFQNIKSACGNSHPVQGKGDLTFHSPTREVRLYSMYLANTKKIIM